MRRRSKPWRFAWPTLSRGEVGGRLIDVSTANATCRSTELLIADLDRLRIVGCAVAD